MKLRCGNPKHSSGNYVGISYCERWNDFRNFLQDMGVRPEGTSLDRIDPLGNYEPSNCRWADILTQENNRTNNTRYEINGKSMTLPQIAREYGVSRSNLANKIYLKKMDMHTALDYLLSKKEVRSNS